MPGPVNGLIDQNVDPDQNMMNGINEDSLNRTEYCF